MYNAIYFLLIYYRVDCLSLLVAVCSSLLVTMVACVIVIACDSRLSSLNFAFEIFPRIFLFDRSFIISNICVVVVQRSQCGINSLHRVKEASAVQVHKERAEALSIVRQQELAQSPDVCISQFL